MAAADAGMASTINSSFIQSVQTSTALATCLGVSLLVLSVHVCVQALKLLYFPEVTTVQMTPAAVHSVCCRLAVKRLCW